MGKLIVGENDLATVNPELAEEWDYEKNYPLTPQQFTKGSHERVFWKCKICEYSWKAEINSRNRGNGCRQCYNKRRSEIMHEKQLQNGLNSVAVKRPEWAKDWDYERNGSLTPDMVTYGSKQKVYWICPICKETWFASPNQRSRAECCPDCAKIKGTMKMQKTILKDGKNTLVAKRPDLLEEWDYEKNAPLTPEMISCGSSRKVYWKCLKCGQSYLQSIDTHCIGRGCSYCSSRLIEAGINDLATKNPKLLEEWDFERNIILPTEVTEKSIEKVYWICKVCGNKWKASINERNKGTGCPKCQKTFKTSLSEQIVYYYVSKCFPDALNSYVPDWLKTRGEIDVYIPSLNLGIEYDGENWHKNTKKDLEKDKLIFANGVRLIRLREKGCPELNDESIVVEVSEIKKDYSHMENVLKQISEIIENEFQIKVSFETNIEKDLTNIIASFENNKKERSLAYQFPDLLEEWDYEKNGQLLPEQVTARNDLSVWWKCKKCGYSWKSHIGDRTNGHGCPACSGRKVFVGFNDLQTLKPELAKEWGYEKNDDLLPTQVVARSNKKVWWKCQKCGYNWQARIADRSVGIGCSACVGKVPIKGKNDLATVYPELAKEWDYEKNYPLTPDSVTCGSNRRVGWICSVCSRKWDTEIVKRTTYGRGCKSCKSKRKK